MNRGANDSVSLLIVGSMDFSFADNHVEGVAQRNERRPVQEVHLKDMAEVATLHVTLTFSHC